MLPRVVVESVFMTFFPTDRETLRMCQEAVALCRKGVTGHYTPLCITRMNTPREWITPAR